VPTCNRIHSFAAIDDKVKAVSNRSKLPTQSSLGLGTISALATITAAIVAGIAALATNVLSIRDNLGRLITGVEPLQVSLRDVRGRGVKAIEGRVVLIVEAVVEKKGTSTTNCEAGLLMRNSEYAAEGVSVGVARQTGDGYYGQGGQPALVSDKLHINLYFQQSLVEFHYGLPEAQFHKSAKFRLDCNGLGYRLGAG
jgi:hypothetical protein